MAIEVPKREHKAHFITSSSRGPILACECGWDQLLERISMSPLHTNATSVFFGAGFDVGRAFERHVQEVEMAKAQTSHQVDVEVPGGPTRLCDNITAHDSHPYKVTHEVGATRYTCPGRTLPVEGPIRPCGRITEHKYHGHRKADDSYTCLGIEDNRCTVPEKHNPHPWEIALQGEPIEYFGCDGKGKYGHYQ